MNFRFALSLICCSILAACSQQETAPTAPSSAPSQAVPAQASPVQAASIAAFNEPKPTDIYQQYAWLNRRAQAQLANANAAQANQLYDAYRIDSDAILQAINDQELSFLENYTDDQYWQNDAKASEPQPTAAMLQKQQHLAQFGLRYVDVGEGMAEIAPLAKTETQLFADKVSPDYQMYILQQDHENNQLAASDAAIVISWAELGTRVAFWESFIQTYPQSPLISEAKSRFVWYSNAFFFGLDNTPVADGLQLEKGATQDEAIRIFDEINHAWTVFERQHPQSRITALLPKVRQIATLSEEDRITAIQQLRQQSPNILTQTASAP